MSAEKIFAKLFAALVLWPVVHFAVPPLFEVPPLAWWLSLLIALGISLIGVEVLDAAFD